MASPLNAPGLAALFVADDLAALQGELVASFPSSAGAVNTLAQATDADKPVMQATGVGGRKGLSLDGVSDRMFTTSATTAGLMVSLSGATFYDVFTIAALPGASANVFGVTTDQTTSLLNMVQTFVITTGEYRAGGRRVNADAFVSVTSTGKNVCDGLPHIGCAVFDYAAATVTVYVDGTAYATAALASAGTTSATSAVRLAMGCAPAAVANFFPGQVAMGAVYHQAHAAASRAEVHSWAQDTYGIAVADYVPSVPPELVANSSATRAMLRLGGM